jgi:hypothetical protein
MIRYAQAAGTEEVCRAIILTCMGEPRPPSIVDAEQRAEQVVTTRRELGRHAQVAVRIVEAKVQQGENVTMSMLVKEWRTKPDRALDWYVHFFNLPFHFFCT